MAGTSGFLATANANIPNHWPLRQPHKQLWNKVLSRLDKKKRMRGEDERKCSLALGRQGWRLGSLCSRKLSLRDTLYTE
jgi:hypothetical protein